MKYLVQVFMGVILKAYSHFFFSLLPTFANPMNLHI